VSISIIGEQRYMHHGARLKSRDIYYDGQGWDGTTHYTYTIATTSVGNVLGRPDKILNYGVWNHNAARYRLYGTLGLNRPRAYSVTGNDGIVRLEIESYEDFTVPAGTLIEIFNGSPPGSIHYTKTYDLGYVIQSNKRENNSIHYNSLTTSSQMVANWQSDGGSTAVPGDWLTILYEQDACSPNFFIPEDTWVNVEYTTPSDATDLSGRERFPVKLYRRAGIWGMSNEWFPNRWKFDLPCKVPTGWWAAGSQGDSFTQAPISTGDTSYEDYGNICSAFFQLTFEKPRFWFDLGANLFTVTKHAAACTPKSPLGFGYDESAEVEGGGEKVINHLTDEVIHDSNVDMEVTDINTMQNIGMITRIVGEDYNGVRLVTRAITNIPASKNMTTHYMPISYLTSAVEIWRGPNRLYVYNPTDPAYVGLTNGEDGYIGTATAYFNNDIHMAITTVSPVWISQGLIVKYMYDPGVADLVGVGQYIRAYTSMDLYCLSGGGDVGSKDIIKLWNTDNDGNVTTPDTLWLWCESAQDIRRDLTTLVPTNPLAIPPPPAEQTPLQPTGGTRNYKMLRVLPYYNIRSHPGRSDVLPNKLVKKMSGFERKNRWLIFRNGSVLAVPVHTCTRSTYGIEEGKEVEELDSKKPQGKEFKTEKFRVDNVTTGQQSNSEVSDDTNVGIVWQVKLPDGSPKLDSNGDPVITVYLSNFSELEVVYYDYYSYTTLIAPPQGQVYLIAGEGDKGKEARLIFSSDMVEQNVYVDYEYYDDNCYISHFAKVGGELYACEFGTGKWYRYDSTPTTDYPNGYAELVSVVKVKELGLNSNIVADESNNLWSTTYPSGFVAKFGTQHTNHIEEMNVSNNLPSTLGGLAQAFNCIVDFTPDNKLVFKPRDLSGYYNTHYLTPDTIYLPTPQHDGTLAVDTVDLTYKNGKVRSGTARRNTRSISSDFIYSREHAQIIADIYRDLDKGQTISVKVVMDRIYRVMDYVVLTYPEVGSIITQIIEVSIDSPQQMYTLKLRKRS